MYSLFSHVMLNKKKGRAASWFVASLGAAAYTYWTNRENGQVFTKEDQTKWNASKEERNR